jgi:hypothetical protein
MPRALAALAWKAGRALTEARCGDPDGIAVDEGGSHFLLKIKTGGLATTIAARDTELTDGQGQSAGFYLTRCIAIDGSGQPLNSLHHKSHDLRSPSAAAAAAQARGFAKPFDDEMAKSKLDDRSFVVCFDRQRGVVSLLCPQFAVCLPCPLCRAPIAGAVITKEFFPKAHGVSRTHVFLQVRPSSLP